MAKTVNMHEAKTTLSQLVERALGGEEVVIARAGRGLVKLVPVGSTGEARRPGRWKGKVWMARDFGTLPDDLLDAFEGKSE